MTAVKKINGSKVSKRINSIFYRHIRKTLYTVVGVDFRK